jgi:dTMP kinase
MTAGWFITFEGGEGSGKSTQAKRLSERLTSEGHAVTVTREPGGSPFAERLRAIILAPNLEKHSPLAEALLFASARADHLEQVIRPALAGGHVVVCDRFSDSTRIYQGYAGHVEPRLLEALELIAEGRSNTSIAERLVIGTGAVEKHVNAIFTKLGLADSGSANRRVLAVLAYLQRG